MWRVRPGLGFHSRPKAGTCRVPGLAGTFREPWLAQSRHFSHCKVKLLQNCSNTIVVLLAMWSIIMIIIPIKHFRTFRDIHPIWFVIWVARNLRDQDIQPIWFLIWGARNLEPRIFLFSAFWLGRSNFQILKGCLGAMYSPIFSLNPLPGAWVSLFKTSAKIYRYIFLQMFWTNWHD